jgi:hypothetical protein
MHSATFTICLNHSPEGCVFVPGPGNPPPGRSFWHFARAARTEGDEGSNPLPVWKRKLPLEFGSGKSGTPFARMHRAYFSASFCNCV